MGPNTEEIILPDILVKSDLPWKNIIRFLGELYPDWRRSFFESTETELILINPVDTDFLHYLKYDTGGIKMYAITREGLKSQIEQTHCAEILNSILYYLVSK
jgi:hypothetical protein